MLLTSPQKILKIYQKETEIRTFWLYTPRGDYIRPCNSKSDTPTKKFLADPYSAGRQLRNGILDIWFSSMRKITPKMASGTPTM